LTKVVASSCSTWHLHGREVKHCAWSAQPADGWTDGDRSLLATPTLISLSTSMYHVSIPALFLHYHLIFIPTYVCTRRVYVRSVDRATHIHMVLFYKTEMGQDSQQLRCLVINESSINRAQFSMRAILAKYCYVFVIVSRS
jgi:hypothetical protein